MRCGRCGHFPGECPCRTPGEVWLGAVIVLTLLVFFGAGTVLLGMGT